VLVPERHHEVLLQRRLRQHVLLLPVERVPLTVAARRRPPLRGGGADGAAGYRQPFGLHQQVVDVQLLLQQQ
jgi:hypothetical protein